MYGEDTFFNLSVPGRTGLAIVSLLLGTLTAAIASLAYTRLDQLPVRFQLVARLATAIALLWLFVWLAPQIYYTYYQAIIPGLPGQIVVQAPPGLYRLIETLSFTGPNTLSEHSKAILGWVLLALAIFPIRRPQTQNARKNSGHSR